jgi:ferredoxin
MWGFVKNAFTSRRDHADCSGCSLCLPVCPVWRQIRDISLTPHGRAKAMQQGESVSVASIESCTLCGACDPVCPEQIDMSGMTLKLRRQVEHPEASTLQARMDEKAAQPLTSNYAAAKWLPDYSLLAHPDLQARITALLGARVAEDDGADIALALEAGVVIPVYRLQRFLAPLKGLQRIIVADGLLLKHLKQLLPGMHFVSLGEALSALKDVRRKLRVSDLYVIEPRAYHSDYQRLVKHYDSLRIECGSAFNLDLQRIAIPVTARSLPQRLGLATNDDDAHARWVLHGRSIARIVVESLEDRIALVKISNIPVVHLAELADDGVRV